MCKINLSLLCYLNWIILIYAQYCNIENEEFCPSLDNANSNLPKKYLLYNVNPGEGFNLRRDVYMRIATLVKKLNEADTSNHWLLVLPPWGPLYHWKSNDIGYQVQIKWSKFFDVYSLSTYVPVIEFEDFLIDHGPELEVVYYLQHYKDWIDGQWQERANIEKCLNDPPYKKVKNDKILGWFWGYEDVYAHEFHCLSIQGYSSTLKTFLLPSKKSTIMIDRAEVILHDAFGNAEYWRVRHSMLFSKKLIAIGNNFRKLELNSTDKNDNTYRDDHWPILKTKRTAIGGPYIGVHLRRQDFAQSRSSDVPSIKYAAQQILKKMAELNIEKVFIATDAPNSEFEELQQYIPTIKRFHPSKIIHKDILDGGVAIIDQWICAHARYFIGTHESTFSFRIQEEREILKFPIETTFNRLCGDNQTSCKQPSKWTITYS